ncbi:GRAM domain-containing protein [Vallitalea okinawensis]|uniref:GRAM domain-containing protein n=1 Tax=Vallitalea okinawensis TaxID=2078660 RepID=UPI000CFAE546|nr:GRAM domain-containing protein [Vallitalea okinawensis]
MNFKLLDGEKVITEGKANRCSLVNAQGGKLYLTNKRIVFVGHGKNIGEGTIAINLSDILTYGKAPTLTIFFPIPVPNAIKVVTDGGKKLKFTVAGRKKWLQEINNVIND